MDIRNKKILVTGAGGFIGSHLTEHLIRLGYNVRAMVRYNSLNSWGWLDNSAPEIKKNLDLVAGDIRDPHGIMHAMQGCEVVLHLAALIGIPYSYCAPDSYIDTNIKGTLNILQAARELGVQKIVHTSTSEVYGTAKFVPITEEHPLQGQSPYSASKIGADQIALSFYRSFETPVAVIRPFNTYGPRQSARAIIPTIILQVNSGKKALHLGALTPTRDFNYITDTVAGFLAVAQSDEAVGEVVNLGNNFEISIGETAGMIAEIMGAAITIEADHERLRPENSEVQRLWAENRKIKKLTNWQPEYSGREGFRRGLLETIKWFSNPANLTGYKADIYNV